MLNRIKSELLNFGLKFISVDEKVVRLFLETSPSNVNEIVILPAIKIVMQKLLQKLQNKRINGRVYNGELNNVKVSVIRSLIGAPHCAMTIECLKRCKTKLIIRIDTCGGIENINFPIIVGDILIPKLAYCDDGTSPQYLRTYPTLMNELKSISNPMTQYSKIIAGNQTVFISEPNITLKEILIEKGASILSNRVKEVNLWTTDALFCETFEFVRSLQTLNVNCVDMESSILFLLGKLFNIKTASLLSVVDLPGNPKYDLLTSKEIHPDMENGIDNAIKILINSLPKIKYELI